MEHNQDNNDEWWQEAMEAMSEWSFFENDFDMSAAIEFDDGIQFDDCLEIDWSDTEIDWDIGIDWGDYDIQQE